MRKWIPNPAGRPPSPVASRFWEKVRITFGGDGCWEWTAALNKDGYGVFNCAAVKTISKKSRYELAHRMAYRLVYRVEILLPHERILHHCDNRKCVRPHHLFRGTQRDNIADAMKKGRMRWPGKVEVS